MHNNKDVLNLKLGKKFGSNTSFCQGLKLACLTGGGGGDFRSENSFAHTL